jgi:hypothetical protein
VPTSRKPTRASSFRLASFSGNTRKTSLWRPPLARRDERAVRPAPAPRSATRTPGTRRRPHSRHAAGTRLPPPRRSRRHHARPRRSASARRAPSGFGPHRQRSAVPSRTWRPRTPGGSAPPPPRAIAAASASVAKRVRVTRPAATLAAAPPRARSRSSGRS